MKEEGADSQRNITNMMIRTAYGTTKKRAQLWLQWHDISNIQTVYKKIAPYLPKVPSKSILYRRALAVYLSHIVSLDAEGLEAEAKRMTGRQ